MIYLRAALHVAGIAALAALTMLFLEARRTVAIYATLPAAADLAVARESENIRRDAAQEIGKLRAALQVEGRLTRQDGLRIAAAYHDMLSARLNDTNAVLYRTAESLTRQTGAIAQPLAATLRNSEVITADAKRVTALAAESADVLLDCEGNPQCVQNRAIGTLQAVERASQEIAKAAPAITAATVKTTEHAAGIAADAHAVSARIARPKRWYEKLLGPAIVALAAASRALF